MTVAELQADLEKIEDKTKHIIFKLETEQLLGAGKHYFPTFNKIKEVDDGVMLEEWFT